MALKGELLSADLSNVFQMLAMNGKRGLLTVQDRVNPVARRRFYLDAQTVFPADEIAVRTSLAMLVEMGRLTYDQYASAMQRSRRFNQDAWSILKAQGTVADEDAAAFLIRASNEHLLEVFLWRDIRFSLDETQTRPSDATSAAIQIDHVVMEAARRQDEWHHIVEAVGSHRDIFRRCHDVVDYTELLPVERIVYDFINGVDSAPDIVLKCELPQYFVDLGLAGLVKRGTVARLGPEELIIAGDRMCAGDQVRVGIRLLHSALRTDRGNIAIHKRLADAHLKSGEIARACAHLRYCSILRLNEGNRREAINLLQQAWKLLPTQFSTLERILSILIEDPRVLTLDDKQCLADGRKLLQVWHDMGELERSVELATRIWSIDQSDREVLHTAARLNLRLGRVDAAVDFYLMLAAIFREDRNLRGALEIFRTIASLGGPYGKAYEGQIEELKAEISRQVTRKKRGLTLRWAMIGSAILAILYAGYAWFGEQVVRDLDERVTADPSSHDALIPDYEAAAFWFRIAPAGAHAQQRAVTMLAEVEAEREAQREKNEALSARITAQNRAADEAVSEGLRMVRAGDLKKAAKRLREGIATFATPESSAASRASKALADVERYLSQGLALLDEARTLEASDPDAAFRLRLKALRDFELLEEVKTLKLALRIESVPHDAKLNIQGAGEHTPPIGIEVGGTGLLAVEAKAQGYLPRSFTLPLPPEVATWTLVLERAPRAAVKTQDPLTGVAPASGAQAIVAARNGPLFLLDVAKNAVVAKFRPEAIDSQSRPPTVSGSRALCVLDDGRVRIVDLPGLKEVRVLRLPVRPEVRPQPFNDGWLVLTAKNRVELLDRDGVSTKKFVLPPGVAVRDVTVMNGTVYCAAGEAGLLAFAPAAESSVLVVSSKYTEALVAGAGTTLLVHRPQVGIVSVDPAAATEKVLFAHRGDVGRIHRIRDDRWAALFDGELVFLSPTGAAGRAKVPGARADRIVICDPASGNAGVIVDGWCSVFDFADGRCVAGFSCEPGANPTFVDRVFINVHQDGRLTLTDP